MQESGVAQGIWPQGKVHCLRPASVCVEQLLARALREIADGALGDAILEMGIHAAEGELLSRIMAGLPEGIVGEAPIVAVVVLDPNAMLGSEGLEGAFGGDGFDRRIIDLEVNIPESTEVVDEDGSATIALLGEFAFELRDKP